MFPPTTTSSPRPSYYQNPFQEDPYSGFFSPNSSNSPYPDLPPLDTQETNNLLGLYDQVDVPPTTFSEPPTLLGRVSSIEHSEEPVSLQQFFLPSPQAFVAYQGAHSILSQASTVDRVSQMSFPPQPVTVSPQAFVAHQGVHSIPSQAATVDRVSQMSFPPQPQRAFSPIETRPSQQNSLQQAPLYSIVSLGPQTNPLTGRVEPTYPGHPSYPEAAYLQVLIPLNLFMNTSSPSMTSPPPHLEAQALAIHGLPSQASSPNILLRQTVAPNRDTSCIHYHVDPNLQLSSSSTTASNRQPWSKEEYAPSPEMKIKTIASGELSPHLQKASYPDDPKLQRALEEFRQLVKTRKITENNINHIIAQHFIGSPPEHKKEVKKFLTSINGQDKIALKRAFPPGSLTTLRRLQSYMLDRLGKVMRYESINYEWLITNNLYAISNHKIISLHDLHTLAVSYNENKPLPLGLNMLDVHKIKVFALCKRELSTPLKQEHIDYLKEAAQKHGGLKIGTAWMLLRAMFGTYISRKDLSPVIAESDILICPKIPHRPAEKTFSIIIDEIHKSIDLRQASSTN